MALETISPKMTRGSISTICIWRREATRVGSCPLITGDNSKNLASTKVLKRRLFLLLKQSGMVTYGMENRARLQEQRSLYTEKLRRIMRHDVLVRLCYPLPPEGKTVLSGGMLMAERLGLRFQRRSQDLERYESSIAGVPFAAIATTVSVIIILCPYYHGCSIGLLEYYSLLHVDPCLALDPTGLAKKLSTPGRADHLDMNKGCRATANGFFFLLQFLGSIHAELQANSAKA